MTAAMLETKRGLSALILSFNEEVNIRKCIESVKRVSSDIWVVDSGSTDKTVEIARSLGVNVEVRGWPGYAQQWNWGLRNLPFKNDYVMIHAADEQIPEAWGAELKEVLDSQDPPDMILTRFRFWWLGRPIEHGQYGRTYIVKVGRRDLMHYQERACNEHIPLQGRVYRMKARYEHRDAKEMERWLQKHLNYARLEYMERERSRRAIQHVPRLIGGGQADRTQWLRINVYDRLPLFVRPFAYFVYRYVIGRGWRDGITGSTFHFLHAFWYPFLIDLHELEGRSARHDDVGHVVGSGPEQTTAA